MTKKRKSKLVKDVEKFLAQARTEATLAHAKIYKLTVLIRKAESLLEAEREHKDA